jgi:hypothetical protein
VATDIVFASWISHLYLHLHLHLHLRESDSVNLSQPFAAYENLERACVGGEPQQDQADMVRQPSVPPSARPALRASG